MRFTRSSCRPSAMSKRSELVAEVRAELRPHERRTGIDPRILRRQPQGHRPDHEHIRIGNALGLGAVIAISAERLEKESPGHGDAGIARTEILLGAIEDRRYAALA